MEWGVRHNEHGCWFSSALGVLTLTRLAKGCEPVGFSERWNLGRVGLGLEKVRIRLREQGGLWRGWAWEGTGRGRHPHRSVSGWYSPPSKISFSCVFVCS